MSLVAPKLWRATLSLMTWRGSSVSAVVCVVVPVLSGSEEKQLIVITWPGLTNQCACFRLQIKYWLLRNNSVQIGILTFSRRESFRHKELSTSKIEEAPEILQETEEFSGGVASRRDAFAIIWNYCAAVTEMGLLELGWTSSKPSTWKVWTFIQFDRHNECG